MKRKVDTIRRKPRIPSGSDRPILKSAVFFIGLLMFLLPVSAAIEPAAASGDIYIIKINAGIGPGVADFITSSITTANEQDGAILIIELDTPGGLAESMR
ncbi:MAG: hypothetical protein ABF303_06955, partial [Desulfobacterales bacterium]